MRRVLGRHDGKASGVSIAHAPVDSGGRCHRTANGVLGVSGSFGPPVAPSQQHHIKCQTTRMATSHMAVPIDTPIRMPLAGARSP
jgi:hypothetical protein